MTIRCRSVKRCDRCVMRPDLCICTLIPSLNLKTRVCFVTHYREIIKTTNTAKLALLSLVNSEQVVRGLREKPISPHHWVKENYHSLVLIPSPDSIELSRDFVQALGKPVQLIVPDGTWNQSRKVAQREIGLRELQRVKLPMGAPSLYRLRHSPHLEDLSTFEAVSRALGIIEGEETERTLMTIFEQMIERVLWTRGKLRSFEVKTIPGVGVQEGLFFQNDNAT